MEISKSKSQNCWIPLQWPVNSLNSFNDNSLNASIYLINIYSEHLIVYSLYL